MEQKQYQSNQVKKFSQRRREFLFLNCVLQPIRNATLFNHERNMVIPERFNNLLETNKRVQKEFCLADQAFMVSLVAKHVIRLAMCVSLSMLLVLLTVASEIDRAENLQSHLTNTFSYIEHPNYYYRSPSGTTDLEAWTPQNGLSTTLLILMTRRQVKFINPLDHKHLNALPRPFEEQPGLLQARCSICGSDNFVPYNEINPHGRWIACILIAFGLVVVEVFVNQLVIFSVYRSLCRRWIKFLSIFIASTAVAVIIHVLMKSSTRGAIDLGTYILLMLNCPIAAGCILLNLAPWQLRLIVQGLLAALFTIAMFRETDLLVMLIWTGIQVIWEIVGNVGWFTRMDKLLPYNIPLLRNYGLIVFYVCTKPVYNEMKRLHPVLRISNVSRGRKFMIHQRRTFNQPMTAVIDDASNKSIILLILILSFKQKLIYISCSIITILFIMISETNTENINMIKKSSTSSHHHVRFDTSLNYLDNQEIPPDNQVSNSHSVNNSKKLYHSMESNLENINQSLSIPKTSGNLFELFKLSRSKSCPTLKSLKVMKTENLNNKFYLKNRSNLMYNHSHESITKQNQSNEEKYEKLSNKTNKKNETTQPVITSMQTQFSRILVRDARTILQFGLTLPFTDLLICNQLVVFATVIRSVLPGLTVMITVAILLSIHSTPHYKMFLLKCPRRLLLVLATLIVMFFCELSGNRTLFSSWHHGLKV